MIVHTFLAVHTAPEAPESTEYVYVGVEITGCPERARTLLLESADIEPDALLYLGKVDWEFAKRGMRA